MGGDLRSQDSPDTSLAAMDEFLCLNQYSTTLEVGQICVVVLLLDQLASAPSKKDRKISQRLLIDQQVFSC